MDIPNPYTLPTIDFVGGSTQDLMFRCYFHKNKKPHDLSYCTANFAVINYINKKGEPPISKPMTIGSDSAGDGSIRNVLKVTLEANETVKLPSGKYIYQISIRDASGDVEIPNQGIIHIVNNIDKGFVK